MAEKLSNLDLIVEKVAKALEEKEVKITKTAVRAVITSLSDACCEVLESNGTVSIPGLFKAELVQRAGRQGYNIITKSKQEIAPHTACKISASGALKNVAKSSETK